MYFKLVFIVCYFIINLSNASAGEFLRIEGNHFYFGDQQIFLSGVNIAWKDYGNDFGNAGYTKQGPVLEEWIREIKEAGGNTLSEIKIIVKIDESLRKM